MPAGDYARLSRLLRLMQRAAVQHAAMRRLRRSGGAGVVPLAPDHWATPVRSAFVGAVLPLQSTRIWKRLGLRFRGAPARVA